LAFPPCTVLDLSLSDGVFSFGRPAPHALTLCTRTECVWRFRIPRGRPAFSDYFLGKWFAGTALVHADFSLASLSQSGVFFCPPALSPQSRKSWYKRQFFDCERTLVGTLFKTLSTGYDPFFDAVVSELIHHLDRTGCGSFMVFFFFQGGNKHHLCQLNFERHHLPFPTSQWTAHPPRYFLPVTFALPFQVKRPPPQCFGSFR